VVGFAALQRSGGRRRQCKIKACATLEPIRVIPARAKVVRFLQESYLGIGRSIFGCGGFLDLHIAKFFGIEDLATLQALDILCVVVPGNDPDLGMFAGGCHRSMCLELLLLFPRCDSRSG